MVSNLSAYAQRMARLSARIFREVPPNLRHQSGGDPKVCMWTYGCGWFQATPGNLASLKPFSSWSQARWNIIKLGTCILIPPLFNITDLIFILACLISFS